MVEVLILAAIALFVLSRLYVALGRDDGPPDGRGRGAGAPLATEPAARTDDAAAQTERPIFSSGGIPGLEEIHAADPDFDPRGFLQGARSAYEMIVEAFAEGDRKTLKPLLDDDVYAAWNQAITDREENGEEPMRLLRLKKAEIESGDLTGRTARVSVRYESDLGDGERTRTAKEIWIFMRNVDNPDPNWLLDDVEPAT
ncbi:MAG: Tim44/TimA family putative adaptor protein, partial [Pseudomonadota bacterium]